MKIELTVAGNVIPDLPMDIWSATITINDTEYRLNEVDDMLQISIFGRLVIRPKADNMIHIKEEE